MGATLPLGKPMRVLRGVGFGGSAGGVPPRTPVTFVGCIVRVWLIYLESHDATFGGKGLPLTMRDGGVAESPAFSSLKL